MLLFLQKKYSKCPTHAPVFVNIKITQWKIRECFIIVSSLDRRLQWFYVLVVLRTFPLCIGGSTLTRHPDTPLSSHPPACGTQDKHKNRKSQKHGWAKTYPHGDKTNTCNTQNSPLPVSHYVLLYFVIGSRNSTLLSGIAGIVAFQQSNILHFCP